jgi:hypothetical protein
MTVAEIVASRKIQNMADVESHGGVWMNGAFVFPDGSRGAFSPSQVFRDENGIRRLQPVFTPD